MFQQMRTHIAIVLDEYGKSFEEDSLLADLMSDFTNPALFESASQCRVFSFGGGHRGVQMMQHGVAWLGLVTGAKLWHVAPPHLPRPSDRTCENDGRIDHKLAKAEGVAAGADGWSLYVTDEENDAVRAIDLTSRRVTTLAGAAAAGDGSRGFADGSFEAARFNKPAGIAATKDGKLLIVADAGNHAIRLLDLEKRVVTTIAGDGAAGAGAFADGNASAARFNRPTGVALSPDGTTLAAGSLDRVVRLGDGRGTPQPLLPEVSEKTR